VALMRISLGPLLTYWQRDAVLRFYEAAARAPLDVVYLGEVVCGKRHQLRAADWIALARMLRDAGKEVVLSTLALPESESDLRVTRAQVANGEFAVEANDLGAVRLASQAGVPFVIGPHINGYHPASVACLARRGAKRWVAPVELSGDAVLAVVRELPAGVESEVFGYGRLPLAMSARCFTARAHGLAKDACEFRCLGHADGFALTTIDHVSAFVVNGTQLHSARSHSLVAALPAIGRAGIGVFRLSPQSTHTFDVVRRVREALDGALDAGAAAASIDALAGEVASTGYWHGRPGVDVCPVAQAAGS
jgi:collagenase-like PrtC family protease